jgi:hypothetical protein
MRLSILISSLTRLKNSSAPILFSSRRPRHWAWAWAVVSCDATHTYIFFFKKKIPFILKSFQGYHHLACVLACSPSLFLVGLVRMLQSGILFFMPILVRARGVVLRHLLMLESGLFISGSQTKRQCQFDPFIFLSLQTIIFLVTCPSCVGQEDAISARKLIKVPPDDAWAS